MDRVASLPHPLVAIVGPTAAGKSALGLRLAAERQGEIVSCDSLQVYRGLDIGSAKPTAEERSAVPHHLVDVVEPEAAFSAAEYAMRARAACRQIADRGRLPIVVGGTGLYLRALLSGLFAGPSRDEGFRRRLEELARRRGRERVHRLLARFDPRAAERIEPADLVRVVRALEVFRATRIPLSRHHVAAEPLTGFRIGVFGIAPDRERLRRQVEARADGMLAGGLLDEVRGLLARGLGPEARPLRAIGYRQAIAVLGGRMDLESARRGIVTETMQYAKRQMTWFRHQADVRWFEDAGAAHAGIAGWLAE
jgi:tRNA dimethylallyltransferase